jgi:hypothetical protein
VNLQSLAYHEKSSRNNAPIPARRKYLLPLSELMKNRRIRYLPDGSS